MPIEAAAKLQHRKTVDAEVLRGPFDPGGQPSLEREHPLHLSLFAWNVRSGLAARQALGTGRLRHGRRPRTDGAAARRTPTRVG